MDFKLEKDEKNRDLGTREHTCGICGEKGLFQSYLAREMMQGTKDEFEYFVCPRCGCLQIAEIPENLGDYYGDSYYSMDFSGDGNFTNPVTDMSSLLDVGCGNGLFLYQMAEKGYGNLYGCDPFIEKDVDYGDRVHIKKSEISGIEGEDQFDYIRFGDSLEHMTNPIEALIHAKRLIKKDGTIGITTPHYPNVAFDMFGPHWFQLDAPRHLFIYSYKTMKYMVEAAGLKMTSFVCDSSITEIVKSFFYQHGVPYNNITNELINKYFSEQDLARLDSLCEEMNKKLNGDHIQVTLMK